MRAPLPAAQFCCPATVSGWTVDARPGRVALFSPEGVEVSPNCAPGDVRDSFRAFMRGLDRGSR